jgi:hypothetical protein
VFKSAGTRDVTYRRTKLFALVDVAEKIIAGEVGPIEGSRTICRLRCDVDDEDDDVFTPFIGIDSESDDLVVGNRALWSEAFLEDRDRRYEAYEEALRPSIAEDCRALIAVLASKLQECPACGFTGWERPPYDAAGTPSYETCACCAFQFGFTDVFEYDSAEWRRRWIQDGMPFRRPPAPPGWDPVRQMRAAKLT